MVCRVLEDPALPAPTEGYVVPFKAFYERGSSMPLHQLLCSLLQCYGLELYHLTPSGLLHLTTFVTLCEAYLRIDHDLDLWKYFFSVHHPQDREAKLTIYSGAVIHVKSGHKAYPYLQIPMPSSISGWRKK
jgi:hypothetical protein